MQALEQASNAKTKKWYNFISSLDQHSNNLNKEVQHIFDKFRELEEQKEKCTRLYREDDIDEEELVNINVGGRIITSNRGILTQQKGSMLEVLFSGRWEKKLHRDESGCIFLDMDPVCFRKLVDYLAMTKYLPEEKIPQPNCLTSSERGPLFKKMIEYFGVELCQNAQGYNTVTVKIKSLMVGENSSDEANDDALNLEEILRNIKKTLTDEEKALEKAKQELKKATQAWEKEQEFIQNFTAPSEKDIINFNVRGTYITVKRSTLRIFKGSVLERQFDDSVWTEQYANEETSKDGSYKQVTDWSKNHTEVPDEVAELIKKYEVKGSELLSLDQEDLKEIVISKSGILALVHKTIKGLQAQSKNNRILFIDHDPYCFGKIIDQHRLKAMTEKSYKPLALYRIRNTEHEAFKKTVDYYFPGELAQLIWEEHSFDSCILSSDECSNINDWLSEEGYKVDLKLLYRASRNGWRAPTFHKKCDNKGPTITIIQSTGGYIFGGFCDTPWSRSGGYKASPKAFIFTIKCYSGLAPTKMKLKSSNDGDAVYHDSSCGPTFGDDDIDVCGMANNSSNSYTDVGDTYECPAGQTGNTFLTGNRNFQAKEVEVFSVQRKFLIGTVSSLNHLLKFGWG